MYIFRCVHVQRFIDTGADEIWLWFLWFNSSPEKWIIKSYTLYVKNHTVLQPVASPTPPPRLGCRYISRIQIFLTCWCQQVKRHGPPVPADGDGRKVGEFEETRSWSFEACHVFLEFLVGWRSFMAGIDVQERKAVKGHEQKHMLNVGICLDFLAPVDFLKASGNLNSCIFIAIAFFPSGDGNMIFM